ncbi:ABC transporter substrate-binding protein [Demequina sediminicola]|uniref:ABC transporter substrate-binding protein n=1 Tax=Demequina sediminicola TaxID=1095026 RepID=UPI000780987A|nr:ABC transporter substrate-binding protein [Demequina sediminicola]
MSVRTMRRASTVALAAVAALTLAACSSSESSEETTEEATAAATTEAAAGFPTTITHAFGDVTIEEEPQRIVTLGSREHELLYSLGVAPYAILESWQGYEHGTGPWAEEDRVAADADPILIPQGELNLELIASYEPDLIINTYPQAAVDQATYDSLSQIAPTIVRQADYVEWGMPLDVELEMIGQAVGKSDVAEEVVSDLDAEYAAIREANPEWQDKAGIVAFYYDGNPGAYDSTDNRNQLLENLGLDTSALDDQLGDSFYIQISAENLDMFDAFDTILWQTATTGEVQSTIEGLPLFPSLSVTETGGHVWITDPTLEGAFFANSPSSIQYSLEALVPQLEAALDGDPATEVPSYSDPASAS